MPLRSSRDETEALLRTQIQEHLEDIADVTRRQDQELNELRKRYEQEFNDIRKRHETETNIIHDSLVDKYRQLNSMQPVSKLPPELLIGIFEHLVTSCIQSFSFTYHWVIETLHVYSHWRAVALGAPTLWCYIDLAKPVASRYMLERSQGCPLEVFERLLLPMDPAERRREALITEVFGQHSHRIQGVHAFANEYYATHTHTVPLFPLIPLTLSDLQSSTTSSTSWRTWITQLPNLKRLVLKGRWTLPAGLLSDYHFPPELEILKLELSIASDTPPVASVLTSLRNCTGVDSRLTELVLTWDAGGSSLLPSDNSFPVLHFPKLRYLSVGDNGPDCTWMLQHIVASPSVRLHVNGNFLYEVVSEAVEKAVLNLISVLLPIQTGGAIAPILQLSIVTESLHNVSRIAFNGFTTPVYSVHPIPDDNSPLRVFSVAFTLPRSWRHRTVEPLLEQYCAHLPISNVQTLHLKYSWGTSSRPPSLYKMILAMPAVSSVHMDVKDTFQILPDLLKPHHTDDKEKFLLLPILTRIDLGRMDNEFEQAASDFYAICENIKQSLFARARISMLPLKVERKVFLYTSKTFLNALVDAFTMGAGYLRGPIWVELEKSGVLVEQFPYSDWDVAIVRIRKMGWRDSLFFRFFVAYTPTTTDVELLP
ncbi:hypothetical protein QCA50_005953 [Cerrena zonata]|uniref:F-box domain-containing protein n=1 Tax=Cerrena zonata TaxID=2478898 RepID=A0AAW0GD49_9APHY